MTKRTQKQRISYAEVDSDHEWPSSEDEDEVGARAGMSKGGKGRGGGRGRGGGDSSYGIALPLKLKKKARRTTSAALGHEKCGRKLFNDRGEPVYDEDLLLKLPFDMLAEVCSHLDTTDLITLAKVSRALRKLLLSPATRSLWAVKRHQTGYDLPKDMNDIAFALFVCGRSCNGCGARWGSQYLFLRVRLCRNCAASQLIHRDRLRSQVRALRLHSDATRCIANHEGAYRLSDLGEASERLNAFDSSADQAGKALYLEQREVIVHEDRQDMTRVAEHKERLESQQWSWPTVFSMTRNLTHHDDLRRNHGFTDEHISFYSSRNPLRLPTIRAPRNPPSVIPEEWKRYRLEVQACLDREEENRRAAPGREARTVFLKDRFHELKPSLVDEVGGVFPTFERFKDFDQIKQLWFPVTAQLDESTWPEQLPVVQSSLRSFAEQARVQAARVILAATEGVQLTSLSEDPADYPASEYGDAFFNRITSSFLTQADPRHAEWSRRHRPALLPFPKCLPGFSNYGLMADRLKSGTNEKQVYAIRIVVEAAGLDVETTTVEEMDALGVAFKWPTCPTRSDRNRKTWINMVPLVERLGPGITKLRAGARVKLQFFPPDAKDVKGKGKAREEVEIIYSDTEDEEYI